MITKVEEKIFPIRRDGQVATLNFSTAGGVTVCYPSASSLYSAGAGISVSEYVISVVTGTTSGTIATGNHTHTGTYLSTSGCAADSAKLGDELPSYYAPLSISVTGATNLGAGETIYTSLSSNNIQLKSLVAGSNVTLTCDANTITIASTASGSSSGSTAGEIPVGGIIMYSGAVASIPANFQLADGTNGTPNLTDKFIYGTTSDACMCCCGGSTTSSSDGEHTHSVAGTAFTLTTSHLPTHSHPFTVRKNSNKENAPNCVTGVYYLSDAGTGGYVCCTTSNAGSGNAHTHPASTAALCGDHTHTVTPPYVKLAFIIRMS